MNDENRKIIPNSESFKLVIRDGEAKIFKAVVPFLFLGISFITIAALFRESFSVLYSVGCLLMASGIVYVRAYISRRKSFSFSEQNTQDVFNISSGFLIFNLFFVAMTLLYSHSPILVLLSFILSAGVYVSHVAVSRFFGKAALPIIEAITIFIIFLAWLVYSFRDYLLHYW